MFAKCFAWFKSIFSESTEDRYDLYKPKERLIYRYWSGTEIVGVDPLLTYKKMMSKGPELSIDMKVATSISQDAGKAHDCMLQKIREIFNVKSMEEGGLSELETIELLDHFLTFCDQSKKNTSPSVISSGETSGASESSLAGSPAMQNSLECGQIEKEPSIDESQKSPTGAQSLWGL